MFSGATLDRALDEEPGTEILKASDKRIIYSPQKLKWIIVSIA